MPGLRHADGAPTLLFDRLTDSGADAPVAEARGRVLDRASLLASIARELELLLSSRAPLTGVAFDRQHSAVDYGIPDLSMFSLAGDGRKEMARRIGQAVAAFESRLANPQVSIESDPARHDRAAVRIEGSIVLGPVMEPVVFRLPLCGNGTDSHNGG
jgi:type VI secretion system lysozyme-like protein